MSNTKIKIKHIGIVIPLCGVAYNMENRYFHLGLREDLGYERYKRMGVTEIFKDEAPYRICKKCLMKIFVKENRFNDKYKHKRWSFYYGNKLNQ